MSKVKGKDHATNPDAAWMIADDRKTTVTALQYIVSHIRGVSDKKAAREDVEAFGKALTGYYSGFMTVDNHEAFGKVADMMSTDAHVIDRSSPESILDGIHSSLSRMRNASERRYIKEKDIRMKKMSNACYAADKALDSMPVKIEKFSEKVRVVKNAADTFSDVYGNDRSNVLLAAAKKDISDYVMISDAYRPVTGSACPQYDVTFGDIEANDFRFSVSQSRGSRAYRPIDNDMSFDSLRAVSKEISFESDDTASDMQTYIDGVLSYLEGHGHGDGVEPPQYEKYISGSYELDCPGRPKDMKKYLHTRLVSDYFDDLRRRQEFNMPNCDYPGRNDPDRGGPEM